ncbi:ribbon-helix-helix protein, CopG family [Faunimonas pinastri]|uniref:ribbon-helix-helix protein, CopG family n=1 Tax=Faunimonas pinastri TaxID=1855383 RepID=UPI0015A7052B|nr:ribbon-helix-helix protein, CopG family [Faunimonas pinastri]
MDQSSHRRRMAQHREQRKAEGFREANVWLRQDTLAEIDELVASGQFRNRSEAIAAAAQAFFKEKTLNT